MGGVRGLNGESFAIVLVGEIARKVGRTPETIRRWLDQGLLKCDRDALNRRVFNDEHVQRCLDLARLSVTAQLQNRKMREIAPEYPQQLDLIEQRDFQTGAKT